MTISNPKYECKKCKGIGYPGGFCTSCGSPIAPAKKDKRERDATEFMHGDVNERLSFRQQMGEWEYDD